MGRFMSILRFFGLVVLNSWSTALGPTYVHYDTASRLDYVCVRKHQADGVSRQVAYLWQSPFLGQTCVGHVPMLCTLARYWIPDNHDVQTHGVSLHQRNVSRQEYLAHSERWQLFSAQTAADITRAFAEADSSDQCPLSVMHDSILRRFHHEFKGSCQSRQLEPWQLARPLLLNKWDHRRLMRKYWFCTPRNAFQSWFHAARFMRLKRQHRRAAREHRQHLFEDVVSNAKVAAARHDTHQLFHIINRYAPKQVRKKVQLRKPDGMMATPLESAALLRTYVAETWSGPSRLGLCFANPPGVPFCVDQLRLALEKIPINKSVARPFSPGLIIRDQAAHLAPLLFQCLTVCGIRIPPTFRRHGRMVGCVLFRRCRNLR